MKLLIIPEDQTQDGFIAQPILEAMLADLGIRGSVGVLPEPRLRGAGDALDQETVRTIIRDNPMVDLFVLVVDRDCNRKGHVEKAAAREAEHPGKLLACVALQELEVWLLALHRDRLADSWAQIRADCDPKERWAEPLLQEIGAVGPGGGRKKAMRALRGELRGLLARCEELAELKNRISELRSNA